MFGSLGLNVLKIDFLDNPKFRTKWRICQVSIPFLYLKQTALLGHRKNTTSGHSRTMPKLWDSLLPFPLSPPMILFILKNWFLPFSFLLHNLLDRKINSIQSFKSQMEHCDPKTRPFFWVLCNCLCNILFPFIL